MVLNVFQGGNSTSRYSSSLPNITYQHAGNNLNDKADADISDTETCLSSETKKNKAKLDR